MLAAKTEYVFSCGGYIQLPRDTPSVLRVSSITFLACILQTRSIVSAEPFAISCSHASILSKSVVLFVKIVLRCARYEDERQRTISIESQNDATLSSRLSFSDNVSSSMDLAILSLRCRWTRERPSLSGWRYGRYSLATRSSLLAYALSRKPLANVTPLPVSHSQRPR